MQQGFVNFMYLGRAMIHPDGFGDNACRSSDGAATVIDTTACSTTATARAGSWAAR